MVTQALALSLSHEQSNQHDDDLVYIGGVPRLPPEVSWPTCKRCGTALTFYLHFAMPEGYPWAGRAINVFACTARCEGPEIAPDGLCDYNTGDEIRVRPGYIPMYDKFFRLLVTTVAVSAPRPGPGARLRFVRLTAKPTASAASKGLRIGGEPAFPRYWPRLKIRYDGRNEVAPLLFQVPRSQRFAPLSGMPPQESFRNRQRQLMNQPPLSDYELFAGGALWVFGLETERGPVAWAIAGVAPSE
jgi:hypothetical protein